MAPRQLPRFVVRQLGDAASERRKRLLVAVAWAASVLFAAATGWQAARWRVARHVPAPGIAAPGGQAIAGRVTPGAGADGTQEDLRQQVANLQRAGQITDIATKELKRNLAERDEEISALRTDLAFYTRLVGSDGQRDGLKVQGARATPVKGSPLAWNLVTTLTRNARSAEILKGHLKLSIEGIQGNRVTTLQGAGLGQAATATEGQLFSFKYFQQVQGSFTLPPGFHPTRLRLVAQADGSPAVTATVPWSDATGKNEVDDVQQH